MDEPPSLRLAIKGFTFRFIATAGALVRAVLAVICILGRLRKRFKPVSAGVDDSVEAPSLAFVSSSDLVDSVSPDAEGPTSDSALAACGFKLFNAGVRLRPSNLFGLPTLNLKERKNCLSCLQVSRCNPFSP